MPSPGTPGFDEWVGYCFTLGHDDFSAGSDDKDRAAREAREERYRMDDTVLVQHLLRLFEDPEFVADRYTDAQITKGIWFIFGLGSFYTHSARSEQVPLDIQVRFMESVVSMYTRLFDRICGRHGKDPDSNLLEIDPLDNAVFMIWDMGGIDGAIDPDRHPHLVDPGFRILETVLATCSTSSCLMSALHGLGELAFQSSHRPNCERIIDSFLARRRPPDWVVEYAADARKGMVQ